MSERLRRDPGLALLLGALIAALAMYAPTLGRGLVNHVDPWLVRDNWIVNDPSWTSLRQIWFDLSPETRFVLGTEYYPVRDVSLMLDHAVWGSWYGGFHATSLSLYLAAIALWFAALTELGIDRRIVGVMVLVWALHPSHAESVAWISERGGVLAAMFAGATAFAYARFRAGRSASWLVLAAIATLGAVWSKAPLVFSIAALGGLELVLPARRVSGKRILVGLGVLGAAALGALIPMLPTIFTAARFGSPATVIGTLGFELELGALALKSSPSYAISAAGPSMLDIAFGGLGAVALLALVLVPARGRWRPPAELRAAAVLWLASWIPVSHLVLPAHAVQVADRDLLLPTLGIALALSVGLVQVASSRARRALIATIVIACGLRGLDAQSNWRDSTTLWRRAVETHRADGNAWALYAEAVTDDGHVDRAFAVIAEGLRNSRSPRLLLRKALLALYGASRKNAITAMREAAVVGEPRAMVNLAMLLLEAGKHADALAWATRGAYTLPMHPSAQRALGIVAMAAKQPRVAVLAFERALRLEPKNTLNKYNLAIALTAMGRHGEAQPYSAACDDDPSFGWRIRVLVDSLRH